MRSITQETVMKNRQKWFVTFSVDVAKRYAKNANRTIYKLPNGAYAIRKIKGIPIVE